MAKRISPPQDLFQWSKLERRPSAETHSAIPAEIEPAGSERLPRHPLSQAFGDLPPATREELAERVRQSGQVREIPILDGHILMDWEVYNIALNSGLPVQFKVFEGEDPLAFVIANRLHLSQWDKGQRAIIAVRLHAWRKRGRPGKSVMTTDLFPMEATSKEKNLKPMSTADMAAAAHVSATLITQAKRMEEFGLSEAVISGDLKFTEARLKAKLVMDAGLGDMVRNGRQDFETAHRKARVVADAGFIKRVMAGELTCEEAYQMALAGVTAEVQPGRTRPITRGELVKQIAELERENRRLSNESARADAAEARAAAAEAEVKRLIATLENSRLAA